MGSLQHNLKKENFIQINIVVRDIERAAKAWAALLGIDVPEIRVNHLQSRGVSSIPTGAKRSPAT